MSEITSRTLLTSFASWDTVFILWANSTSNSALTCTWDVRFITSSRASVRFSFAFMISFLLSWASIIELLISSLITIAFLVASSTTVTDFSTFSPTPSAVVDSSCDIEALSEELCFEVSINSFSEVIRALKLIAIWESSSGAFSSTFKVRFLLSPIFKRVSLNLLIGLIIFTLIVNIEILIITSNTTIDHITILFLILFGTISTSASSISEIIAHLKSLPISIAEKEDKTELPL